MNKVSGAAARVGGEVGSMVAASDYPRAPGGGVGVSRNALSPSIGISERTFALRGLLLLARHTKQGECV